MKHGKRLFVLLLVCFLCAWIAPNYALADTLELRIPIGYPTTNWMDAYNAKFGTNYVENDLGWLVIYSCTLGHLNVINYGGAFIWGLGPGLARFSVRTEDGWGSIIRTDTMEVTVYTTAQCADPVASPAGGEFASFPQSVTLTCPTVGADAMIHYTTDGSTPTANDPFVASGSAVSVGAGQTLKAISISPYYADSGVTSETYTQMATCAMPTANPPGGIYATFPQSVTLDCSTPGAAIYYTTDGSIPTGASPAYGGAVSINAGETLKAIAILAGYIDSAIMSETYAKSSISGSSGPDPGIPPKPKYEQATIGHCGEWANVRSGPGTDYDIIGQALLNETVELIEWDATGTWCKVFYNGGESTGWVHGSFIIPQ